MPLVPDSLGEIHSLGLRFLLGQASFWLHGSLLVNAYSGVARETVSQTEQSARAHLNGPL